MIHLSKSPHNKKFYVAGLATNRNKLTTTEANGLSSRRAAFKNIRAQMKLFGAKTVLVQDNCNGAPKVLNVGLSKVAVVNDITPVAPYVPGKPKK